MQAGTTENFADATLLHHLATTVSWHLLLWCLWKCIIEELLSLTLGQLLASLILFLNLFDLLGNLVSFKLSLRGLLTSGKEGDVLLNPSAWVLRSAPDFIMPAILDHLEVSYQLETGTVSLNTLLA